MTKIRKELKLEKDLVEELIKLTPINNLNKFIIKIIREWLIYRAAGWVITEGKIAKFHKDNSSDNK